MCVCVCVYVCVCVGGGYDYEGVHQIARWRRMEATSVGVGLVGTGA